MLMNTAIRECLLYLEAERGYSTHTVKSCRSDLFLFSEFVEQQGHSSSVSEVTTGQVRAWVVDMKQRGLSNNTIARRIHALRSFWRYLLDTEQVDYDPLRKVSTPKKKQKPPRYLKADATAGDSRRCPGAP